MTHFFCVMILGYINDIRLHKRIPVENCSRRVEKYKWLLMNESSLSFIWRISRNDCKNNKQNACLCWLVNKASCLSDCKKNIIYVMLFLLQSICFWYVCSALNTIFANSFRVISYNWLYPFTFSFAHLLVALFLFSSLPTNNLPKEYCMAMHATVYVEHIHRQMVFFYRQSFFQIPGSLLTARWKNTGALPCT